MRRRSTAPPPTLKPAETTSPIILAGARRQPSARGTSFCSSPLPIASSFLFSRYNPLSFRFPHAFTFCLARLGLHSCLYRALGWQVRRRGNSACQPSGDPAAHQGLPLAGAEGTKRVVTRSRPPAHARRCVTWGRAASGRAAGWGRPRWGGGVRVQTEVEGGRCGPVGGEEEGRGTWRPMFGAFLLFPPQRRP